MPKADPSEASACMKPTTAFSIPTLALFEIDTLVKTNFISKICTINH